MLMNVREEEEEAEEKEEKEREEGVTNALALDTRKQWSVAKEKRIDRHVLELLMMIYLLFETTMVMMMMN